MIPKKIVKPKKVAYSKVVSSNGGYFIEVSSPCYKDKVHFSITQSDEELCREMRKLKIKERDITDYFTHKNNRMADGRVKTWSTYTIILVRVIDSLHSPQSFGTLVHEIVHACHRLFESWEKKLRFENREEVMCNLVNYYFEQIVEATEANITSYTGKKISWEQTHWMEFNFSLHKHKK